MFIALTVFAYLHETIKRLRRRGNEQKELPSTAEAVVEEATTCLEPLEKKAPNLSLIPETRSTDNCDGNDIKMSKPVEGNDDTSNGDDAQVVIFKAGDKKSCHSIFGENVKIMTSAGKHDHGSSKVKLKSFVDYKWEEKYYPGHLIAVHRDGKYIAYAINVNNKATRMEGMIRVVNANAGLRALIKGMSGEVLDLQFANIERTHLLASIDLNSLYVHRIDLVDVSLIWNLVLKIEDPLVNHTPKLDKIAWCPFINVEEEEDEDESQLVVWSRGNIFQCFDVKNIVSRHGTGAVQPTSLKAGYIKFTEESLITSVALSPDGTTIAAASNDGIVRFYQVYMFDDQNHRCLHQWKPHDGKPLTSLFFLDNTSRHSVDSTFWKYAITGAENNMEFKVWDCSLWSCMQTVRINTQNTIQKTPQFIAEIDRTASYLVVTSLETRSAYIFQILNNIQSERKNTSKSSEGSATSRASTRLLNAANGNTSSDSSTAFVSFNRSSEVLPVSINSVAEFPLNSGILSFSIVDAGVRRLKCSNDNYICEELDDYDDETNLVSSVVVRMFVVQSKSMQECHIIYQPAVIESTELRSSLALTPNKSTDSAEANNLENSKESELSDFNVISVDVDEIKQEKSSPEPTAINMIFSAAAASKTRHNRNATTSSSAVVAVAAAAAAAPSAVSQEPQLKSRSTSPKKAYLMTPDAFSSTTTPGASSDKKTPDVSSDVLNTLLMLASVTGGQAPSKGDNVNLINLVNNKLIEDQEHKKLHLKQNVDAHKKFISIDSDPGRNAAETLASGGSSPSREVQEIMSIQDDKFLDELSDLIDEMPISPLTEEALANDVNEMQTTQNDNVDDWPKAPEVLKVQPKQSVELQNAANIMSQAVHATNNNNAPPALGSVSATLGGSINTCSNNNLSSSHDSSNTSVELSDINSKINQLIDLVQMQSKQIHSLQCEIAEMKNSDPFDANKNFSEFPLKLELQLSQVLERYLKRYEAEHKQKLTTYMQARTIQNREIREVMLQIINHYVINQFTEVARKVITIEIQNQLMPMLSAKIDHMQQQIQMDVTQKLTTFDLMLKENIGQVCKSKHFIDAFGKSVLIGVQNSLQAAFIESMGSTLIPAYEKSSQLMFKQLHDAFSVGIKDFLVQFDSYLQHLKPMQDSSEQMVIKFGTFRQHLESALAKHCNAVSDAMLDTQKEVKSLEILLGRQVQETIRSELRKNFDSQSVAIRSQANTPAPTYDLKQTIKHLLQQGHINKAFHQALLANDLTLVEFTLKNTDLTSVFEPKCCLEQKVLLSLIQQLSADMSNHNEMKQNYLSEALLAINADDPIAREHAPKVLQDLYRSCQLFLKNYPKSPHCSNVRMTMKAVHSYINQF